MLDTEIVLFGSTVIANGVPIRPVYLRFNDKSTFKLQAQSHGFTLAGALCEKGESFNIYLEIMKTNVQCTCLQPFQENVLNLVSLRTLQIKNLGNKWLLIK